MNKSINNKKLIDKIEMFKNLTKTNYVNCIKLLLLFFNFHRTTKILNNLLNLSDRLCIIQFCTKRYYCHSLKIECFYF